MDTQQVGIIGRQYVIEQLMRSGVEVSIPIRDRGIDLIAYLDINRFAAVPIQVKSASKRSFSIDRKYEQLPRLVFAYVWGVGEGSPKIYLMGYGDVKKVANTLGWLNTNSWLDRGKYSNSNPSVALQDLLEPFRVQGNMWHDLLNGM